jgi:hypothetical protein
VIGLVEALEKLHSIRLRDNRVKGILSRTLREEGEVLKSIEQPGIFRRPHMGFLNNGPALLGYIIERRKLKKLFCSMDCVLNS